MSLKGDGIGINYTPDAVVGFSLKLRELQLAIFEHLRSQTTAF